MWEWGLGRTGEERNCLPYHHRRPRKALDLPDLDKTVIIPGRAFVHNREAEKVLSRDGIQRAVIRGPEMLTADAETSMGMTRNDVLSLEMEGFADLIRLINLTEQGRR